MKIKLIAFSLLLAVGSASAQENDPVIMTINGKSVLRSEFEYSYNKNNTGNVIDRKSIKDYVPLFVNYKLKVEEALNQKLDTMSSFKREFLMYRDQQIKPKIIDNNDLLNFAYKMYCQTKEQVGKEGLFLPAHIFVRVKQNATEEELRLAKQRIDSIYNVIMYSKEDPKDTFVKLANKLSDDAQTAKRGGVFGWISKGQFMKEFEERMFKMEKGDISTPFQTTAGYHIMMLADKKPLESFDEAKGNILQYIEMKGMRDYIAEEKVDSIAKASNGVYTKEQLMDKYSADMEKENSNFKNLIREYHDGLLLYEISNNEIWGSKNTNKKKLTKFFKKNKKRYAWDEPRFKGIAYHTKAEADIEAVKNSIKKKKFEDWAYTLRNTFNNDSVLRIRVEKGIFKKGDNGIVDKYEFGVEDAKIDSIKNYPYNSTYGKILEKGPECMEDVKGLVTADYQDMLEKEWIESLRSKYEVRIKEDVLETVNKHDK